VRRLSFLRLRSTRARIAAAVALVVLVGAGVGIYLYEQHRTGSIYHRDVRFVPEATNPKPKPPKEATFVWPFYGYTEDHHRYLAAPASVKPPFRRVWESKETALLEFPPVMSHERIFQLADDGVLSAIDRKTGRLIWSKQLGALSASTPAIVGGTVYVTLLARISDGEGGRVAALNASNGSIAWSRNLPSRSESSPMVANGKVMFGSEDGTVYALNATSGQTIWTYKAAGAVKASPTLVNGVLYFGDYAGDVQAISERTGRRIWVAGSEGAPLGSGTFYSTAAYAYGRIYLGNTDGRIYAYDAGTGELAWAVQTGAYVYASPSVADAPGLGPTIYEGSYDGNFYAVNARTGKIEWTYPAGGKISGSSTIVGKVVYFADLGTHSTTGLNTTTGRKVFSIAQGAFDPVISDGHLIYLSGYNVLFAFEPVDEHGSGNTGAATGSKRQAAQTAKAGHSKAATASRSSRATRRTSAAGHSSG
jgi:outer membrane protein assembly factor BamB